MLDFNDYQHLTRETAIYPEAGSGSFNALAYVVLGLANEAGEVAGKLKKIWRDSDGVVNPEHVTALAGELGDVVWYLARVADELGIPLTEIAEANVNKLVSRKARGVIGGSGDNR